MVGLQQPAARACVSCSRRRRPPPPLRADFAGTGAAELAVLCTSPWVPASQWRLYGWWTRPARQRRRSRARAPRRRWWTPGGARLFDGRAHAKNRRPPAPTRLAAVARGVARGALLPRGVVQDFHPLPPSRWHTPTNPVPEVHARVTRGCALGRNTCLLAQRAPSGGRLDPVAHLQVPRCKVGGGRAGERRRCPSATPPAQRAHTQSAPPLK